MAIRAHSPELLPPESSIEIVKGGHTGLFTEADLSEEKTNIFINAYVGDRNESGQRHGIGTFTNPRTGSVYEGVYRHDKKQGKGTMSYHSGDSYNGSWTDNKKNGFGEYTWANGNKYEGDWVDDMMVGKGIITWVGGDKYEGDVRRNKREGKGRQTYANGEVFKGDYHKDRKHGEGWMKFEDGTKFNGTWKKNTMVYVHNACTMYFPSLSLSLFVTI